MMSQGTLIFELPNTNILVSESLVARLVGPYVDIDGSLETLARMSFVMCG